MASPAALVANQAVTLISAVTSSTGAAAPSGTLTFLNGESPIAGCADEPVDPVAQSVVVTCQTWFGASTPQLSAVFSASADAAAPGSTSPSLSLTVGRTDSSISLDASKTVGVGASTTYTATVSAPSGLGTLQPTGTVAFFDEGQAIASCAGQPLINGGATCAVAYNGPGSHSITAQYGGDGNFRGSSASAHPVTVEQPPPQVLGLISSTMQWTFNSTSTYTKILALVVNGASGDTVTTSCRGGGCPFARRAASVTNTTRCPAQRGSRACPTNGRIDLTPGFRNRRLAVGGQITVTITRAGWVGRYYRFTIRARRPPRVQIACLAPGATRAGVGC